MNTTKKGTVLEVVVEMLEKHLTTYQNTTVQRNIHMKDCNGISHQVDVYVEHFFNKKKHSMIIECKNYSKPVGIGEIREFNDLCNSLRINKKIFVTNTSYTKKAIQKANVDNIELCIIEEKDIKQAPKLLSDEPITMLKQEYELISVSFDSNELKTEFPNQTLEIKYHFYEGKRKKLINIPELVKDLIDSNPNIINELFFKETEKGINITANRVEECEIIIAKENDLFVNYKSQYYKVDEILVVIKCWLNYIEQESRNFNVYKSFSSETEFANFISSSFTSNQQKFSLNIIQSENETEYYIIDDNDKDKLIKLEDLGLLKKVNISNPLGNEESKKSL